MLGLGIGRFIRIQNFSIGKILNNIKFNNIHLTRLKSRIYGDNKEYNEYLLSQLKNTWVKKGRWAEGRAALFAAKLDTLYGLDPAFRVLCVGCRNAAEIEVLQSYGVRDVVGIDLLSEDPRIVVMDMHRMTFEDDRFDVIYATHILEHTFDLDQAVSEITRVARSGAAVAVEVPVSFEPTEIERTDLDGIEGLLAAFGRHVDRVLWTEHQLPNTPSNEEGSEIARALFVLRKDN